MYKLKLIFSLLVLSTLFFSYNFNPPNGKTGAPFDGSCTDCHKGVNQKYAGFLTLEGLPDEVSFGETYPLELKMTITKGSPRRSGFQIVSAGDDSERLNGGLFIPSESKEAVFNKKKRDYLEHKGSKNYNGENFVSWKFDWKVTDTLAADSIIFYATSVIANGSENSGDRVVKTKFKVAVNHPITDVDAVEVDSWAIYPNPVQNLLEITINTPNFKGQIMDIYGNINLEFQNENKIDISNLANGVYFLKIENKIERFIKI